jgi:hypothetical protein
MMFKKHYLERLCLMMIFVKFEKLKNEVKEDDNLKI